MHVLWRIFLIGAAAFGLALAFFQNLDKGVFRLTFHDVGMGDAIQVSYRNLNLLIDGGPDSSISWLQTLYDSPFKCDYTFLFLTHPHLDHLGGLSRLVEYCSISKIFINRIPYDSNAYKNFLTKIDHLESIQKTQISSLFKNQSLKFGDLNLYVLWPPKFGEDSFNELTNNPNNTSLVILLDFNDFEVLLMGDLEKEFHSEIRLGLEKLSSEIQDGVDVLKVPHQGSKDALNEDFLLWLQPKIAVLSIGPNSYGHPDASYIDFLSAQGVTLLRTDELGSIVFKPCYEGKKSVKNSC